MNYKSSTGQIVQLASRSMGRGGEAQVWPIIGAPELVAKIYHHPTTPHQAKLEFMVAHPAQRNSRHPWVAWPVGNLFSAGSRPAFAGYLMPKIAGAHQIFNAYNQKARCKKMPNFDYRHLLRCGRNLAAALGLAHEQDYVVGDLNESNVLVSDDACVTLIDADSWQLNDAAHDRIYRSPVAKADFLPPELQQQSLRNVVRQPWHDNFSLAILLFKLVGEGAHPYDGVYHGLGDVPTVAARIAAGEFPYHDSSGQWRPAPLALPFDRLPARLQTLFLQAFETGRTRPQSRPDAHAWQEAFTLAESELHACHRNPNHWFWGSQCVWCERKRILCGRDPFPGGILRAGRRVATVPHAEPPLVHVSRRPSKTLAAPASPKGQNSDANETDESPDLGLGEMVLLALVITGGLTFLAGAVRLILQIANTPK
jgi:DNA-binding helix-hairpin-helix protein with protein kinase domain